MKKIRISILAMGLIVALMSFMSCNDDCSWDDVRRPTALVTVYPNGAEGFTMQLDDKTVLVPTNLKASPFGEKTVRALVNYEDETATNGSYRNVKINWIDSIRTKNPVMTLGDDDLKVYGNDPVEIIRDWVTVAEDGFLTLRLRTLWSGNTIHVFNLVGGVNKENEYEFNLTHNANGDVRGRMGDALIAFDLNSIWKDKTDSVKIKVNWNSFSGKKSAEFSLLMHKNNPKMAVEPLSLNRCVN